MESPQPPRRPLVLFDGSCGFCTRSIGRWRREGEGRVNVEPVQGGEGIPFGFPPDRPMGALQLVESSGEIRCGAAAVFRMMDLCGNLFGRLAWTLYRKVGPFRYLADRGYALVSARRAALSRMICAVPGSSQRI